MKDLSTLNKLNITYISILRIKRFFFKYEERQCNLRVYQNEKNVNIYKRKIIISIISLYLFFSKLV